MEAKTKQMDSVGLEETDHSFEDFQSNSVYYAGYEGDDEVFIELADKTIIETARSVREPRVRRISDVIDSIGDVSPSCSDRSHCHFQELGSCCGGGDCCPRCPRVGHGVQPGVQVQITESDGKKCQQSPPVTPGSDLGYYSTGLGTPPSQFNFRFSSSSMEPASPPKWDNTATDAQPYTGYNESARVQLHGIMPVERNSDEYNMNHTRRGLAVIFNHEEFQGGIMPARKGSHIDVEQLESVLKLLHFEVQVHNNLNCNQISEALQNLAAADHWDCDCLLVIVLTHGMKNNCLYAKDFMYPADSLWLPFTGDRCLSLAGKPKIFIIQACRGESLDAGVKLVSRTHHDSSNSSYKIPTMADFFIAYSTAEGYYSWRDPEKGTWFIQSLCHVLSENHKDLDLQKMMTRVSRRVAVDFESYNDQYLAHHEQKQVPNMHSTLIREVYFRPKA